MPIVQKIHKVLSDSPCDLSGTLIQGIDLNFSKVVDYLSGILSPKDRLSMSSHEKHTVKIMGLSSIFSPLTAELECSTKLDTYCIVNIPEESREAAMHVSTAHTLGGASYNAEILI